MIKNYQLVCSTSIYAEVGNAISAMLKRRRITLDQAIQMFHKSGGVEALAGWRLAPPHSLDTEYAYRQPAKASTPPAFF